MRIIRTIRTIRTTKQYKYTSPNILHPDKYTSSNLNNDLITSSNTSNDSDVPLFIPIKEQDLKH